MSLDYQLPHSALALAPLDTVNVSQDLLEYVPLHLHPLSCSPSPHPPYGYLLTSLPPERKSPSLLIDRLPTTTTSMLIWIGPRVVAYSKIRATPTPHRVLRPHHVWLHPKLFTQPRLSVILLHSSPLSAHPNPLVRPLPTYLQPTRANAVRGESQ